MTTTTKPRVTETATVLTALAATLPVPGAIGLAMAKQMLGPECDGFRARLRARNGVGTFNGVRVKLDAAAEFGLALAAPGDGADTAPQTRIGGGRTRGEI
jgi:hypothetical protein